MLVKFIALTLMLGLCLYAIFLYTKPIPGGIQRRDTPIRTAATEQPASQLSFSPPQLTLNDFSVHKLMIIIDAANNELTSAQLELKYDPEKLTVTTVSPGEFFPDPLTPITDPTARHGRVEFAVTIPDAASPVSGRGSLALLSIQRSPTATVSATTAIEFLPKTSLRGRTTPHSLLEKTESVTIELPALPVLPPSL